MYVDSYVSNTIASQMSEYFPDNRNTVTTEGLAHAPIPGTI